MAEDKITSITIQKRQRPLRIRSKALGAILSLRSLRIGDFEFILKLEGKLLEDREFTAKLIHHQIIRPTIDEASIHRLPDYALLHIARRWGNQELVLPRGNTTHITTYQEFHEQASSLENTFKEQMRGVASALEPKIVLRNLLPEGTISDLSKIGESAMNLQGLGKLSESVLNIQKMLSSSLGFQVTSSFNQILRNLTPTLDLLNRYNQEQRAYFLEMIRLMPPPELFQITNLLNPICLQFTDVFRSIGADLSAMLPYIDTPVPRYLPNKSVIPSISGLAERLEIATGPAAGTMTGEEVSKPGEAVFDYMLDQWIVGYAKQADPDYGYQVDNAIYQKTCSDQFEKNLVHILRGSSTLRKRLVKLQSAIRVHRRAEFELSVPTLMPQLEGIISDLLTSRGLANRTGSYLIRKGVDRKLRGFRDKIDLYLENTPNSPPVAKICQYIIGGIIPKRNAEEHGDITNDCNKENSTNLLVLIYYFACQQMEWDRLYSNGSIP